MKLKNIILLAFMLVLAGCFTSCKEEPPIIEPTIELEMGRYKVVEPEPTPGRYFDDIEFQDRENLAFYGTVLTVIVNYKYEITKDTIRLTSVSGHTTNHYFRIINSTKFGIEFTSVSLSPIYIVYEKTNNIN
jgi:hypothetical protein